MRPIKTLVLSTLLLVAAPAVAQNGSATYDIEFDATWSAATHPNAFPPNPHFSPLIGGTHNSSVTFWQVGGTATSGIEVMAETGGTNNLRNEVNVAIGAGTADKVLQFGGIGTSPNSRNDSFTVTTEYSRLTLVSMLAPSPDWFVGVSGLELLQSGQWVDSLVIPLQLWDAGSDNGVTYLSSNSNTAPKDPIAGISTTVGPFQSQSTIVGTFTITRRASSLVYGCGINPDGSMSVFGAPPTVGGTTELVIDDPIGTLALPAPVLLAVSALPSVAFPCGIQIPFVGLSAVGAPGELLVRPQIATVGLPPYVGSPLLFEVTIPDIPELAGQSVYFQGLFMDAIAPRVGLTNGVELKIGA